MGLENVKSKAKEAKEKVEFEILKGLDWIHNNKEELVVATPIILGTLGFAGKAIKSGAKRYEVRAEEKKRKLTVYDPSIGCYIDLKRPLKSSEKVMLGTKPKDVTVTQVLNSLNLIK